LPISQRSPTVAPTTRHRCPKTDLASSTVFTRAVSTRARAPRR
jgi:hypothetical protein